jgi:hypothetical protein
VNHVLHPPIAIRYFGRTQDRFQPSWFFDELEHLVMTAVFGSSFLPVEGVGTCKAELHRSFRCSDKVLFPQEASNTVTERMQVGGDTAPDANAISGWCHSGTC